MENCKENSMSKSNSCTHTSLSPVQLDHCYAKPWNWRQETAHCKPVRTLFAEDVAVPISKPTEVIDIETVQPTKIVSVLDTENTIKSMIESEHQLSLLSTEEKSEDWEESVKREGWTPLQHRVFNKVVKLLAGCNLSGLATVNLDNEAVHKKIHTEGFAKKLRIILSSVAWDVKITQWLHLTLIEHLNQEYLMQYIGILQVLRNRVPTLVDRMLNTPLAVNKLSPLNTQIMNYVINKPWEPVLKTNILPVTKLPAQPIIIMVPSGSSNFNTSSRSLSGSRRFQTWQNLLSSIGRVLTVSLHSVCAPHTIPLPMFVEAVITATVQRVQELKSNCPGRPIILAGLQQGALIAAQVAYMEPVTALLCLGFPLFCVDGKRGEPDDFILDIRSPTLIAIGQSSSTCTIDGIEELRHRMKAESVLLVVDGATDSLRMLKWKKKQQNVTQSMVDACILEDISTFLTAVMSQSANASEKRSHSNGTKTESAAAKRSRTSVEHAATADDSAHPALTGHDYSQSTPLTTWFAQPVKGRSGGGTGLTRVRGGRAAPSHSRGGNQKNLSDGSLSATNSPKSDSNFSSNSKHDGPTVVTKVKHPNQYSISGRMARLGNVVNQRNILIGSADGVARPIVNRLVGSLGSLGSLGTARSSPNLLDAETLTPDSKSTVGSCEGSPKEEVCHRPLLNECKGGDSSETESAPPADDDEDVLEDLRFATEFLNKMQPAKRVELLLQQTSSVNDNSLQSSADEDDLPLAEVCRRLNVENLNRQKNEKSEKTE